MNLNVATNEYYGLTDNGIFLQKLIIRGLQKLRFEEIVIIVFLLLMSLIRLIAGFSLLPKESLMYLLLVFTILLLNIYSYLRFSHSRFFRIEFFNMIRDIFPILCLIAIYDSFTNRGAMTAPELSHYLHRGKDYTFLLAKADKWIFGNQVSFILEPMINPTLTDFLTLCYVSFLFYPILPHICFFVSALRSGNPERHWRKRRRYNIQIILTSLLGYVGYLSFPTTSPVFYFDYTIDLHGGQFSEKVRQALACYRNAHMDCCLFPSLHIALTFIVLVCLFKNYRPVAWLCTPLIFSLWFSTLYLRRHFFVDIVAGLVTALIGLSISPFVDRWWSQRVMGIRNLGHKNEC